MKLSKLLFLAVAASTLAGCDFPFGGDEKADPKLYHLTFTSNLNLTTEQKDEIKATYAYGVRSKTVQEGVRPQEEIDELKNAGATDADIEKAGKRQDDGSYFFFDQDPMFIEAPNVMGYKLSGFYEGDKKVYKPGLTDIDHEMLQGIWNMNNKDTSLEARYEKLTYSYYFNDMESGDTNPNERGTYCYLDEGVKTLLPAATTNPHKHFVGWEYEDTIHLDDQGHPTWVLLEDNKLPIDYTEDSMRLNARWETDMFKVSFKFVKEIDVETHSNLEFDDVIKTMSLTGTNVTVDGVKDQNNGYPGLLVNKNSEIKMEYGSDLFIYFTLNEGLQTHCFEINDVRQNSIDCSHLVPPYIHIHTDKVGGDYLINKDSVITFVVADAK